MRAQVGQGDSAPDPRAKPGDELPIVYNPQHPTGDVRDSRTPENHRGVYLLPGVTMFGLVGGSLASRGLVRAERRERAGGAAGW
ncbi:hypothetical protein GA0074704_3297 [Micromonospora siamensis]|uniref:DUF3592 domain-containing protein n=1 Tax=Micromonospora siamensis TaxID=299152 RepID=A0A1C5IE77_9ACTN|nr:hypothetical protein GA0074704_3297 [Micromonospora siamensis]